MDIRPNTPPRTFTTGANRDVVINHCADVVLDADEQVTFVTGSGTQYDVVRKAWGYYATPSLNGRLREMGLRAALVRNAAGKAYLLLVEHGKAGEFQAYLEAEGIQVICWLDRDDIIRSLEDFVAPAASG
jgi:hypothetical protein